MRICLHRILILALVVAGPVVMRTNGKDMYPRETVTSTALDTMVSDSFISFNDINWPTEYAVMQTSAFNTSFTCVGTFGEWFGQRGSGWPADHFETPPNSNLEYLFMAAIWIGGIVGEDTLVSTGVGGWLNYDHEFHPPHYPDSGSIRSLNGTGCSSMRAEFCDTAMDPTAVELHVPLGLKCRINSHVWRTEKYSDIVLYDLVVTNIRNETIRSSYFGIYCDPDIFATWTVDGHTDDLAGGFRDEGIAYAIDNDGDLGVSYANHPEFEGLSKCFALKLVASSHEFTDTNFNWWVNNFVTADDFGPRQLGTPDDPFRDFSTGVLGTPADDAERYYVLSHREWDYDQVFTSSIQADDPKWCYPPQPLADNLTNGIDTKLLLSYGPIDLEPDSSLRIIFAMFTGDSIHVVPDNLDNIFVNLPKYISNLDFGDMLLNSGRTGEFADRILNPLLPVTGLSVAHQDLDSVVVEWDPWVFDDIDHFQHYLSEVPPDSIYYPGLVPPWLRPAVLTPLMPPSLSLDTRVTVKDLAPDKFYFFNVAHHDGVHVGDPGDPIFIYQRPRYTAPVIDQLYALYSVGGSAELSWKRPDIPDLDHYNVYRFEDEDDYDERFFPFYDRGQRADEITPKDTFLIDDSTCYYYYAMGPYATAGSNDTTFIITDPAEGHRYVVTAVDKYGFESGFSNCVFPLESFPRTQEVLIVTVSRIMDPLFTTREWISSFYHEVLDGYDYDIYYYADTMAALEDCWDPEGECFHWTDLGRYKLVILDEDWRDVALNVKYEDRVQPLTKYLLSGGKLAFFGNLAGLNIFFSTLSPARYYEQNHWFVERFFGIDSVYFYPYTFYSSQTTVPYVDTSFGFLQAISQTAQYPDLTFDTLGNPLSSFILKYWPSNTAPCVSTFRTNNMGEVTHLFKSRYPETSRLESHPVGVHTLTDEAETYLFGFHLWSMQRDQARLLIDRMFIGPPIDTGISPSPELPRDFNLRQNYPNPFNPTTVIAFDLPAGADVTLEIHNILGQRVRTLLADTHLPAGTHTVEWDGNDGSGDKVASGVYFYSLKTDKNTANRKMLLLK